MPRCGAASSSRYDTDPYIRSVYTVRIYGGLRCLSLQMEYCSDTLRNLIDRKELLTGPHRAPCIRPVYTVRIRIRINCALPHRAIPERGRRRELFQVVASSIRIRIYGSVYGIRIMTVGALPGCGGSFGRCWRV